MTCDRCGRYIPLKASACPSCASSGTSDPDRERRIHQVEQAAKDGKRRFKAALVWSALGILGTLIWMGSGHFGRRTRYYSQLPEPLATLVLILFCVGVVFVILRSGYRVVTISPREHRREWFGALWELLSIIGVILFFAVVMMLGFARKGGN